jgi:RNA recognition motif-containing protein
LFVEIDLCTQHPGKGCGKAAVCLQDFSCFVSEMLPQVILMFVTYHREPRGFGFIQYCDPEDAADAKYYMDGQVLLGREITVVFAEENRKKPDEMKVRERARYEI